MHIPQYILPLFIALLIFSPLSAQYQGGLADGHANTQSYAIDLNGGKPCGKDLFEDNDTRESATDLPALGIHRNANICPAGDQDWFLVRGNPQKPYMRISLRKMPFDLDLSLHFGNGTLITESTNTGLESEVIYHYSNSTAQQYFVKVATSLDTSSTKGYALHIHRSSTPYTPQIATGTRANESSLYQGETESQRALSNPWKVFPNPAKEQVQIQLNATQTERAQLYLIDTQGRIHKNQKLALSQGFNDFRINLQALAAGMYVLRVQTQEHHYIQRLQILP